MGVGKVKWYDEEVMLIVTGASDEFLTELAFQGEALAKENITANGQVDTGFMRNAVYGRGPTGNHGDRLPPQKTRVHSRKQNRDVDVERANVLGIADSEAVIHAAAAYSIYQEGKKPFLYPALEGLKSQAGGIIEKVGKKYFG